MLKQNIKLALCLLFITWASQMVSSSVFAQLPPPISPWLGMFDRSRGPGQLDNYNRVVKPQQDLMKAYTAQSNQLQAQQRALLELQSGMSSSSGTGVRDLAGSAEPSSGRGGMLLSAPREIPSMQRNPAGFNQYLHYYPTNSMPRRTVPNFSQPGRGR